MAMMRTREKLLIALCCAACASTAWMYTSDQHAVDVPAPLSAAPSVAADDATNTTAPVSVAATPARLAAQDLPAPDEAQQAQFSEFERRFRNDGRDAAWSYATEQKLLDAAADPALTALGMPTSFHTDCSTHMCKTTMDFASRSVADDWLQFYPVGMGEEIGSVDTMQTVDPSGAIRVVIFGARRGHNELLWTASSTNQGRVRQQRT